MMAFRMSPATNSTGYSPYYIVFGKEMSLPLDVSLTPRETAQQQTKQYVDQLVQRLKVVQELAKANTREAQLATKHRFDQKTKEPSFRVGDYVHIQIAHIPVGLSKKLYPRWEGPYYITELGPNNTYRLRRCSDNKEMKSLVHANRLKHYKDPRDYRPPTPDTADTVTQTAKAPHDQSSNSHAPTDNSTEWYSVDKLLKSKWISGKKHYLVKWTDGSTPSWQPTENVSPALKEAFHRTRTQSNTRRKRLGRIFRN